METKVKNESLKVVLKDSKGQQETFTTMVIGDSDKFSGKALRKGLQEHVIRLVTLPVKHGVNRGCRIDVAIQFRGMTFALKPIYFGGYTNNPERAGGQLKTQLAALVIDVKELLG